MALACGLGCQLTQDLLIELFLLDRRETVLKGHEAQRPAVVPLYVMSRLGNIEGIIHLIVSQAVQPDPRPYGLLSSFCSDFNF